MVTSSKRDNSYWQKRLLKDGHGDLLAKVNSGNLTVYKATQQAGYRKSGAKQPAETLSYHWKRADHAQRKRFVLAHLQEVNRVLREVGQELRQVKAKKPND